MVFDQKDPEDRQGDREQGEEPDQLDHPKTPKSPGRWAAARRYGVGTEEGLLPE